MKKLKIILFSVLCLIILFLGFQSYFFIKYKGNIVISVDFESSIGTPIDISVLIDDKILIKKTVEDNECYVSEGNKQYFIIAENGIFAKPGKYIITVESKTRGLKEFYSINVCFFKYIRISYYPHFLQFIEFEKLTEEERQNVIEDSENAIEEWGEERFKIWEYWLPTQRM